MTPTLDFFGLTAISRLLSPNFHGSLTLIQNKNGEAIVEAKIDRSIDRPREIRNGVRNYSIPGFTQLHFYCYSSSKVYFVFNYKERFKIQTIHLFEVFCSSCFPVCFKRVKFSANDVISDLKSMFPTEEKGQKQIGKWSTQFDKNLRPAN